MRLTELDQVVRRHRALLAGLLAAAAVATALPLLAPDAPPSVQVVAAARDLAPGQPLTADDLTTVTVPTSLAPESALYDPEAAVGRAVTGAVRRGELLTDVRLLGAGLLRGHGLVAAPVRLADPETLALLHAGDHVDVLASPTSSDEAVASAVTVASNVQVLAVPAVDDGADGGLVVLAATPATAARLAAAAVAARLSVTVLPPG